jgi:hypothetical protein
MWLSKIKKHWFLIFLLCLVILTKLPFLIDQTFPFTFDHGKDSLAVLKMMISHRPSLIGPWTSIPGLFFGPGWYYLLLPGFIISGGDPIAGVLTMIAVMSVLVYVVYKKFGYVAATVFTTTQTWFSLAQSAWNPFPLALISVLIYILLDMVIKQKSSSPKTFFWLGILSGLGFHFSSAFAIFYPMIVGSYVFFFRVRVHLKDAVLWLLGLLIPFTPQLFFELRNNFIEVKSVYEYLFGNYGNTANTTPIVEVINQSFSEFKLATLPTIYGNFFIDKLLRYSTLLIIFIFSLKRDSIKKLQPVIVKSLIWTPLPIVGFSFLHFNTWYLLGLLPALTILIASLISLTPRKIQIIILLVYICSPLSKVFYYYQNDRTSLLDQRSFLVTKIKALDYIEQTAGNKPYKQFHYLPEIYDYSYQYLLFWRAMGGHSLPSEFSYMHDEVSYIKEKAVLVDYLTQTLPDSIESRAPELIYFIVEKPSEDVLLKEWWNHQNYQKIISEKKINSEVTVYQAVANPI